MSSITITVAHLAPVTVPAEDAVATLARTLVEDARYYGAWNYREAEALVEAGNLVGNLNGAPLACGSEYEIVVAPAA